MVKDGHANRRFGNFDGFEIIYAVVIGYEARLHVGLEQTLGFLSMSARWSALRIQLQPLTTFTVVAIMIWISLVTVVAEVFLLGERRLGNNRNRKLCCSKIGPSFIHVGSWQKRACSWKKTCRQLQAAGYARYCKLLEKKSRNQGFLAEKYRTQHESPSGKLNSVVTTGKKPVGVSSRTSLQCSSSDNMGARR